MSKDFMLFQCTCAKGSGVFMQEQRWSSYSYRPAQRRTLPQQFTKVEEIPDANSYRPARRRTLSPLARIGVLVPIALVLLIYTKTWDAAPRFATQWLATQWFTAPK